MKGITKRFASTLANDHVDFSVEKGEIHSLLGENGAGKTTLMHILYGMTIPDEGEVYVNGHKANITSPREAINNGIAMVHQHFMLVEPMTVTENIVLGYEPRKGLCFDKSVAVQQVSELSKQYGLFIDPYAKVADLDVGTKQRLEILKALYRKADILILDEPTAVLTRGEVDDLFRVLRTLRANGKTIIIITHKLGEIMAISDRVTVLNNGKLIGVYKTAETNSAELAERMVGRHVSFSVQRTATEKPGPIALQLDNIHYIKNRVTKLRDINLRLHSGEVLGIAGVEGNGQTELVEIITGLVAASQGRIIVGNTEVPHPTPHRMIDLGVGHIPEDRNHRGLISSFSIRENIMLGYQTKSVFSHRGLIDITSSNNYAKKVLQEYIIKATGTEALASSLSGGNQQKVVIGRVLSQNPNVIIAAQPTRGVDIGAIEYIHQEIIRMKESGKGVLLVSAELEEVVKLSDRIAIMYAGEIVALDTPDNFDEYRFGTLMTGLGKRKDSD